MHSPLERGNRPDIKRANHDLINIITRPLVEQAYEGYLSDWIAVNGLYRSNGSTMPKHFIKVCCYLDDIGEIRLIGLDKRTSACFSYEPISSNPTLIDGTINVYRDEGSGLGTSIFQLGLHLLDRIGPQLNHDSVYGYVADVAGPMKPLSTSSRDYWTSSAIDGFGYTSDAKILQEVGLDQTAENVFIKKLKK